MKVINRRSVFLLGLLSQRLLVLLFALRIWSLEQSDAYVEASSLHTSHAHLRVKAHPSELAAVLSCESPGQTFKPSMLNSNPKISSGLTGNQQGVFARASLSRVVGLEQKIRVCCVLWRSMFS